MLVAPESNGYRGLPSLTGIDRMNSSPPEVMLLLRRWSAGDSDARTQLIPVRVRRAACACAPPARWRPFESSLDTTELVHETYLKLVDARHVELRDRANFLALASEVMRNLLVDRARARLAAKRGGGARPVDLETHELVTDENLEVVADLDDALQRLATLNPRQSELLQHRYFGGLTLEESAAASGVSLATAKRELRLARAWLALELKGEPLL